MAVAERHGWAVVRTFEDAGISGAKSRDGRPGLVALMKAVARREIDMVAAWSVDRLGRSLTDLLELLREMHSKGVDLFLHQQGLDTSTPGGRAMFQMMGVFAEFERAMLRERVVSGLARARENGTRLGRPKLAADKEQAIRHGARADGRGHKANRPGAGRRRGDGVAGYWGGPLVIHKPMEEINVCSNQTSLTRSWRSCVACAPCHTELLRQPGNPAVDAVQHL